MITHILRRSILSLFAATLLSIAYPANSFAQTPQEPAATPAKTTLAVLPFQERGREVEELGGKVADLLLKDLLLDSDLFLVDRQDLKKVLEEQELGKAGLTTPESAARVGQLTGAKVLISGSVFQVGDKLYVVAKLVGTETSRVAGASVKGKPTDDLDQLVTELSRQVVTELRKKEAELIAAPARRDDRIAAIRKSMTGEARPSIWIDVTERHVGQPSVDPAAATELASLLTDLGFTVIDRQAGTKSDADVLLVGEGLSQHAAKNGNLTSVKARVELKAVERTTGRLIASDRQVSIAVDSAELIAAKTALQDSASSLAARIIPRLTKP